MKPPKRLGNMQYPPVQSICKSTLSIAISNVLATWNPLFLYRGTGIGGCWLDPDDMSTMFQDAAGTTPVTAMEQPVGKWLDKSGNGNHATQSVTASRPVISARKNLLTKTEDFADEVWVKQFAGTASAPVVTNNYGVSPDDTQTAARLVLTINGGATTTDLSCLSQGNSTLLTAICTSSIWVKSNTTQSYTVQQRTGLASQNIIVDTTWRKYTFTSTSTGNTANWLALRGAQGTSDYADILIWHPQLVVGTTVGNYQRVNTATDYDTVGFKKYIKFDGVDDYLNLPYMGLYLNGSAAIVAARDALSQATDTYVISERSTSNVNPKYFPSRQLANAGNMDAYIVNDAGTVAVDTVGSAYGGASDAVIRSAIDSGNNIKLFKNGALAANDNYTRSGTLTLTNTTIGASVSTTTSNYANMKLYGLVITKSALSDTERRRVERWLADNCGVQL